MGGLRFNDAQRAEIREKIKAGVILEDLVEEYQCNWKLISKIAGNRPPYLVVGEPKLVLRRYPNDHPKSQIGVQRRSRRDNSSDKQGLWLRRLLRKARTKSGRKGLEFDLTEELQMPIHCPLLGIKLEYVFYGSGEYLPNSASLDRIDPSKGYTMANVWVISRRANTIKNNATLEEFELIAKNWRKHHG